MHFRVLPLLGLLVLSVHSKELLHRSDIRVRDPYILVDEKTKTYYMYASIANRLGVAALDMTEITNGVEVYQSKDLVRWSQPKTVFEVPSDFWAKKAVWAPEVHRYRGRYYLMATFTSDTPLPTLPGRPPNVKRGTQILVSDSPEGPFILFANAPHTPDDWMCLDGTLWEEEGVPYMIFCHEWIQITDGTMDLVPLKPDLSETVGEPKTLFRASDASWSRCRADLGERFQGERYHAHITDGPFIHRTQTGKLVMLWSSYGVQKYALGQAVSKSGTIHGPWEVVQEPLFDADGGHGMIFRSLEGKLLVVLHQPNRRTERAHFFEISDEGDLLEFVDKYEP